MSSCRCRCSNLALKIYIAVSITRFNQIGTQKLRVFFVQQTLRFICRLIGEVEFDLYQCNQREMAFSSFTKIKV